MGTVTAIDGVRVFTGDGLTEPRRVYLDGAEIGTGRTPDVGVDGRGGYCCPA